MPARLISRLALVAGVVFAGAPSSRGAEPPPVESFEYTRNLQPIAASLRTPSPASDVNTDLAFWRETAFQGTYEGFRIIDISAPEDPSAVLDYDDCKGSQGDLVVWDDILIRSWNSPASPNTTTNPPSPPTCDGEEVPLQEEGLHVFDISDRSNPDLLTFVPLPCGSHTATAVPDLVNDRLLVYNSGSSSTCPGIDIVDVPLDAPETASLLRSEPSGRSCHDTAVILGGAMLAACAGGNGLTMWSLGGPRGGSLEDPQQLWTRAIEGVTLGHAATFSWDGTIVGFGHEPGGGVNPECEPQDDAVKKTFFFLDSESGSELGRWILPRPQTAQENCAIHNFNTVPSPTRNILVSGNYQSGIAVVDFTNPAQPREIAYADPAPLQPEQSGGDWSAYWYDGYIWEGDSTRGLIVWRFTGRAASDALPQSYLNPQTQESTIEFQGRVRTTRCLGKAVTLFGSLGDDVMKGTRKDDVVSTGSGRDKVAGGKGHDRICAGRGRDVLRGGPGADVLGGQGGRDRLNGGPGPDACRGGPKTDRQRSCEGRAVR